MTPAAALQYRLSLCHCPFDYFTAITISPGAWTPPAGSCYSRSRTKYIPAISRIERDAASYALFLR